MRIVGSSRDYYDTARSLGVDRDHVFVRAAFERAADVPAADCGIAAVEFESLRIKQSDQRRYFGSGRDTVVNRLGQFEFEPFVVWFAGVRFAGVKIVATAKRGDISAPVRSTVWSADDLRGYLASIEAELADEGWSLDGDLNEGNADAWFGDTGSADQRAWLVANGISIAISHDANGGFSHGHRWKAGRGWKFDTDGLKDLGFAKVMPPYQAFQNLDMWVGGVLPEPGRPMVEIGSDTVRRDKHGFDDWSFKKQKAQRLG